MDKLKLTQKNLMKTIHNEVLTCSEIQFYEIDNQNMLASQQGIMKRRIWMMEVKKDKV